MSSELALRPATGMLEFSEAQTQLIRDTFANGASNEEFSVLMEVARVRGLNPLLRQIYFVKRYDGMKRREVWSTQISIDGLRAVAQRTGVYAGQDEPEYVYDEKSRKLVACKVRVYRATWGNRASVGVAHYEEYVQKTREGQVTQFWGRMPHVMLAKCAEALAIRKAFPEDTAGLYVPEEMGAGAVIEGVLAEDAAPPARAMGVAKQVAALDAPAQSPALAALNADLAKHPGAIPVERAQELVREHYPRVAAEGNGAIIVAQSVVKERVEHGGKGKVAEVFTEQGRAMAAERRAAATPANDEAPRDWRVDDLSDAEGDHDTTRALKSALRDAAGGAAVGARWREAGPSVKTLPERDAKVCYDAVVARWAQLMGTMDAAVADRAFREALKSEPDPSPKGPRKAAPKAPAADAQGSASEGTAGTGSQARAPLAESFPYAQSADQWAAHLAAKSRPHDVAGSFAKHSPAIRLAGQVVTAQRLRAAVGRHMALSGLSEGESEACILGVERERNEAAAIEARAAATGRSVSSLLREKRDASERDEVAFVAQGFANARRNAD